MGEVGFVKLGKDVGIDLGTSSVLVYVLGKGIVLREPSIISMRTKSKEVLPLARKRSEW